MGEFTMKRFSSCRPPSSSCGDPLHLDSPLLFWSPLSSGFDSSPCCCCCSTSSSHLHFHLVATSCATPPGGPPLLSASAPLLRALASAASSSCVYSSEPRFFFVQCKLRLLLPGGTFCGIIPLQCRSMALRVLLAILEM